MAGDGQSPSPGLSTTAHTPIEYFRGVPKLACQRHSPRPCINQKLVDQLKFIRDDRFLKFGSQHSKSISYATCISVIIGCPYLIETVEQARALHKVGDKLERRIEEFLRTGKIEEAERIAQDPEHLALKELSTVHGVGYTRANELYKKGIKTLQQLKDSGEWPSNYNPAYHVSIQEKIPRSEVESIHEMIKIQLDRVQPGAHTVICGGFRRGKEFSNDIDIIFTYPHQEGKERGVLKKLVHRLQGKGLIPSDGLLHVQNAGSNRTSTHNKPASSFDALDHAFIIFKHPANYTTRMKDSWRRVDLIGANWASFGAAVLGWTGSTQFERDLRRHAHSINMKFDSGGLRMRDTDAMLPNQTTEEDVFRTLGLEWIPPTLRAADP